MWRLETFMIDFKSVPARLSAVVIFAVALLAGCAHSPSAGSIALKADNVSVNAGTSTQLHATDTNTLGMTSDVTSSATWSSSDPAVASVSSTGLLTGLTAGNSAISAKYNGDAGSLNVTIGAPAITALTVTAPAATVYTGLTLQYTATAMYANGTTGNVTSSVQWSVLPAGVATISANGLVTATAAGNFVVTASSGGQTASHPGTASNAPLTSIAITPGSASVAGGATRQFTATGSFADNTTADLSSSVTWSSSNTALLAVSSTGLASAFGNAQATTVTLTAASGSISGSTLVTVTPGATITSLYSLPTSSSIAAGTAEQHTALAFYSDGTQKDVTDQVSWSVVANSIPGASKTARPHDSSTNVATINASGVNTATTPGMALVQASLGSMTAQSTLIVTPATIVSLDISASKALFPIGAAQPLVLTGTFSDGSQQDLSLSANWQSSNPGVATISSSGMAIGVQSGAVVFSASFGGINARTIGFQVLPSTLISTMIDVSNPTEVQGVSQQLHLFGTYTDGTTHDLTSLATWTSADPTVYSVDQNGLAVALNPGSTQITGNVFGRSALTTIVSVNVPLLSLQVLPVNKSFSLGTTQAFTLLGHFAGGFQVELTNTAIWTSNDPTVMTIAPGGLAKSGKLGSTTITATALGITQTSSPTTVTGARLVNLAITPNTAQVGVFTAAQFAATGIFSDGSSQDLTNDVLWDTSDNTMASVDLDGTVIGLKPGTVQVSASFAGMTVIVPLKVTSATLVSVAISPQVSVLPVTVVQQFSLIGTFSDGTTEDLTQSAIWSEPTPTIVAVILKGNVVPNAVGTGFITAQYGFFSASATVRVTDAILSALALTPASTIIRQGQTQPFKVIGTFSDGSLADLTKLDAIFNSDDGSIASIDEGASAFGAGVGSTRVTASYAGLTAATTRFQVLSNVLTSIVLTPLQPSLVAGGTTQLTAIGTYADGTSADISNQLTWSSSNPAVLAVDEDGTLFATTLPGSSIITGTSGATGQSVTVTVVPTGTPITPPTLVSLAVNPAVTSLAPGSTTQLAVTGTYSDLSTADLSSSVTWSSLNASVAAVTNTGLVTAVASGVTSVQAQLGGVQAISAVTVTGGIPVPTLNSLAVVPTSSQIAAGTSVPLLALGFYSDGTTRDLSAAVTWTSTNPTLATVTNTGLASGLAPGLVTIQAQMNTGASTNQTGGGLANAHAATSLLSSSTLKVTGATLASVAISPSGASFAAGATQQFTLTGTYSDGSTQNVSSSATWSSSAPAVAAISSTGLATGTAPGAVQFTASYNGQTATSGTDQITAATLVSIALSPASLNLAHGTSQQFTVTGTYSDASTHDLTSQASFTSSNSSVVQLSVTGLATGIAVGSAQVSASVGGQTATTQSLNVTPATLSSITINPNSPSFASGSVQQFTATGIFSDGTTQDLSTQAVWSSSSPQVLTINAQGLATSSGSGAVQVSAVFSGVTGTTGTVQMTAATLSSLSITPASAQVAKGTAQQFTATGTYTDGSVQDLSNVVTWTSSNGAVAGISATGLATGTGLGTAQLTATYQGKGALASNLSVSPATLVSIAFSPASPSVAAGTTAQVTVTGTFSDGSTQNLSSSASYSSSNPAAVTISPTGLLSGLATGSSTVTVTVNGVTNSFTSTVTSAVLSSIAITPATPAALAKGSTEQLTATGTFTDGSTQNLSSTAVWSSSNPAVFSINSSGLATGTGVGTASLTASFGGQTATTPGVQVNPATISSMTVTPANPSVNAGSTQQFTATATYTDGTTANLSSSITWSSSNPVLLNIDGNGLATASATLSAALVTVTATSGTGPAAVANSTTVTVLPQGSPNPGQATLTGLTLTPTSARIANGTATQFTAMGSYSDGSTQDLSNSVIWTSSNTANATVNAQGVATSVAAGTITLTGQSGSIQSQATLIVTSAMLTSVAVSPTSASFAVGSPEQFTLTGTFSDGSHQNLNASATWTSSASATASISSAGLATAVSAGSVQFTGSFGGQSATTASVQVTPATLLSVAVTPAFPNFAKGTGQQFRVIGAYSDGTTADLTSQASFTSSNPAVVSVSSNGLAHGLNSGVAQISVSVDGQAASTGLVFVTPATLVSISVTPPNPSFAAGTTQRFDAIGTFSDNSTEDLSSQAVWSSSNPQVATIDANGNAESGTVGSTQISVTMNGITSTTGTVQVTPATLTALTVTPATASIAAGATQQFIATGTFSDGSTQNLSSIVSWSSTSTGTATINASGLASGIALGTSTISAQSNGITSAVQGSAALTVTAGGPSQATLQQINITPSSSGATAGVSGQTQQFTATGLYSDATSQNITSQVAWSSSAPGVATIDASGLATFVAAGNSTVQAQLAGVTGSDSVVVTAASVVLQGLVVTPGTSSIPNGGEQQFHAIGSYSDGSTADLTTQVTWTSSVTSVATITSTGITTGQTGGTSQITARISNQTATATQSVSVATLTGLAVTPSSVSLASGTSQQFKAIGTLSNGSTLDLTNSAFWSTSSTSVATINQSGFASTRNTGSATIAAESGSFTSTSAMTVTAVAVTSMQITPSTVTIPAGGVQQLLVTANFSDGTSQNVTTSVTYTSSKPSIATVNVSGSLSSLATGSATITATLGAVSINLPVTVTAATLNSIAITPAHPTLPAGTSQQLTATGSYSDGSTQDLTQSVTWVSGTPANVSVSTTGNATVLQTGSASITASSGSVSSSDTVTGIDAVITAISVSPTSATLAAGQTQQFAATATLSDSTQQNVTASADWSVGDPSRATVSNSSPNKGFLTSSAAGTTTAIATLNSISGSAAVTIQAATLNSIAITPNPVSLPAGTTQALSVIGSYSDGSTSNLTASATYTSASSSTASVDSTGVMHGVTADSTSITATVNGVSSTNQVTVTGAALTAITIAPTSVSLPLGSHQQLTATGSYTDGSTADITSQVHWSSANPAIGTVSGTGLISTLATGSSTLTATLNSFSQHIGLTVTSAVLQSIAVTAPQTGFALGQSLQLTATGTWSDGTTQDLTSSVTWSSSAPSKGVVSSTGLANGVSPGSFNGTATMNGITGSVSITVTNAVLTSIVVTPASLIILNISGNATQFVATGLYSDGSTQVITNSVLWSATGLNLGSISSTGSYSPIGVGVGSIIATSGTISGSTPFILVSVAGIL